jgi:hypothetical protein
MIVEITSGAADSPAEAPTTAPIAPLIPGCSAVTVGTGCRCDSTPAGVKNVIWSSGNPTEWARAASVRERKTPVTASILNQSLLSVTCFLSAQIPQNLASRPDIKARDVSYDSEPEIGTMAARTCATRIPRLAAAGTLGHMRYKIKLTSMRLKYITAAISLARRRPQVTRLGAPKSLTASWFCQRSLLLGLRSVFFYCR